MASAGGNAYHTATQGKPGDVARPGSLAQSSSLAHVGPKSHSLIEQGAVAAVIP